MHNYRRNSRNSTSNYDNVGELRNMSLRLITKRGTSNKIDEDDISYNWAGQTFKEYQSRRTASVILSKRNKTVITSARGTVTKYLENSSEIESSKPKMAYITSERGTKRRLIKIN